jgi:hypothetical protein
MALDDLASDQPIAVVLAASLEAFDALVRTEGCSADVAPDKAKSSTTYGTELCWAVSSLQGAIKHFHLLWALRKSGSFHSFLCMHWSVREMTTPRGSCEPAKALERAKRRALFAGRLADGSSPHCGSASY